MRLDGKVAIVTGGASGFGAGIVAKFLAEGAKVMIAATLNAFGRVDILVNNAGTTHLPAPMENVTEDDFDKVFAVNYKSVYLTAKHVVPIMKQQGAGCILNVASTAGVSRVLG